MNLFDSGLAVRFKSIKPQMIDSLARLVIGQREYYEREIL
jgi:hypothetical protein